MRNEILVRLHAAGASHGELRLFSNVLELFESTTIARPNPVRIPSLSELRRLLADATIRDDRLDLLTSGFFKDSSARAFDRAAAVRSRVVTERDGEYPSAFLNMPRRPFLLYVR